MEKCINTNWKIHILLRHVFHKRNTITKDSVSDEQCRERIHEKFKPIWVMFKKQEECPDYGDSLQSAFVDLGEKRR